MIKIILALVTATGMVMLPHVANAFIKGEFTKTKELLYKSFSFVTFMSVPMMFGLIGVSRTFVPLFFTSKFAIVSTLMNLEAIVIVFIAWSNVLGIQYLLPTQRNKDFTTSVVFGAIVNIVLNVPFIWLWGAVGATWSTVISEAVVTGYQIFVLRKDINLRRLFTGTYKYLIAGLIMFIVVNFLNYRLSATWSMIFVQVIVGIVVYLIILLLLRSDIFSLAKKTFKK